MSARLSCLTRRSARWLAGCVWAIAAWSTPARAETVLTRAFSAPSPEFDRLQRSLESYGFTVRLEAPPRWGTYGQLQGKTQTIWINPVAFELGNADATLIHEAVHAAQTCAGENGNLRPLGLDIQPPKLTRPYFLRYHNHIRRQLEAEAYTVPAQPNAIAIVHDLLQQHCPLPD
ncbi:MAG: hypothetical protein AAFX40_09120 [Cyanobacteria bacterium J06639_1]